MSGEQDNAAFEAFADLTLELGPPSLQFEDGNVVIRLGEDRSDILVLHEEVLSAASDRFGTRFSSSHWTPAREVTHPSTGEKARIFEYQLLEIDDTLCLTDEVLVP